MINSYRKTNIKYNLIHFYIKKANYTNVLVGLFYRRL